MDRPEKPQWSYEIFETDSSWYRKVGMSRTLTSLMHAFLPLTTRMFHS